MTTAFTRDDIDISTRAADQFTRLYYSTYDSPTRVDDLPKFYRATSTLTWNGNPCQGVEGVRKLIQNMPSTKHEVQSYDCHPIPGSRPPSLLVTVAGNVTHGKSSEHPVTTPSRSVDGQPRVFFQTFMLVPDPAAPVAGVGEVAKFTQPVLEEFANHWNLAGLSQFIHEATSPSTSSGHSIKARVYDYANIVGH